MELPFVADVVGPPGHELLAFDVAPSGDLVTVWQVPVPYPWAGQQWVAVSDSLLQVSEAQLEAGRATSARYLDQVLAQPVTVRRFSREDRDPVDTVIVPGIEVDRVAVSDRYLVLVGTNWEIDRTAARLDLVSGELRHGLLGWDVTDVVLSDAGELWVGYGDQACYGDPPVEAPADVVAAMVSGLALFTPDFGVEWCFEGRWAGPLRRVEDVYFIHLDAGDRAVVWDGLGGFVSFVDFRDGTRQMEWDWDREQRHLVGALRTDDELCLIAVDDDEQVELLHVSRQGAAFVVDRIERVDVPPSERLWLSECWRTRDDRVDLVVDGRWYHATLDGLLESR